MAKTVSSSRDNKQAISIPDPRFFVPRKYQIDLFNALDSGCKRAFVRWCRRAGKDFTFMNYMFRAMIMRPGNYYYILPEYGQGRKAIFEGITKGGVKYLDCMPKEFLKGNINRNEMRFETFNGSIFRIVGGDKYDTSIVGTGLAGVCISEYALQNPNLIDFLRPILNESGAWLLINGTPRGKNHMYDLEANIRTNKNWYFSEVQTLWPDLPNYYEIATMHDIDEDRKAGMSEEKIEQEYGVSYVAGQMGAYYADQVKIARAGGRIGKHDYDPTLPVDTFWDLGKNDATAIWFRQIQGSRKVFIDYFEDCNKAPNYYAQILSEKGYWYGRHYMPHDAAHDRLEGCLKTIFRNCFDAVRIPSLISIAPRVSQKIDAINAVRSQFGRYFFDEQNCGKALIMISLYHRRFDERKRTFMDSPEHDWTSHCADALSTEALTDHMNTHRNSRPVIISDFNPLFRGEL